MEGMMMGLMFFWGISLIQVAIYLASPSDFIAANAGFCFGLALANTFNSINQ